MVGGSCERSDLFGDCAGLAVVAWAYWSSVCVLIVII